MRQIEGDTVSLGSRPVFRRSSQPIKFIFKDKSGRYTMQEKEIQDEKAARRGMERAAKPSTYVVKSGDSLSKIAKEIYGDAKRWTEILEANKDKIKDPNQIAPGLELRIP
jgi:nucleoid-associated protein YgaU